MNFILILLIHPGYELTKSVGTALMRMIFRPLLVQSGAKVGRCAYASFIIQIEKRWKRMFIALLLEEASCYTDEWKAYNHIIRKHSTVCHAKGEWARDDNGDGIREVHTNTAEGMWTDVRNFLRPFKGVHKKYLCGYVAMAEFRRNLKRISPAFIASIVASH